MSINCSSVKRSPSRPDVSQQVCRPSSLRAPEDAGGELGLQQRLAAGQRNAALADLEHLRVLAHDLHRLGDAERLAVAHVPGVRIVAILAAQQAAGQERDEPQARAVDGAAELRGVDVADQLLVALLGDRLDVALVDVEVRLCPIWRAPPRRDRARSG